MSKKKSDLKSAATPNPLQQRRKAALADCAQMLAVTLLLGCKTRGQFAVAKSRTP